MDNQNSIPKAIENFVVKGDINTSETHVDYHHDSESVVTWSLSDFPEISIIPSNFIRRISDVRIILRLKKQREEHAEKVRNVKVQMAKVNNGELVTITPDIAELFKMIDQF